MLNKIQRPAYLPGSPANEAELLHACEKNIQSIDSKVETHDELVPRSKECVGRDRVLERKTASPSARSRAANRIRSQEATRSVLVEGTVPDCTADCTRGCLKASSWDGARCGQRPETPQTKKPGRARGVKLGSAAADCFSWEAPQVGRNSTSISPFTFLLWRFHSNVSDV